MSSAPDPARRDPFRAPTLAGALLLWATLCFTSCKEKDPTPAWNEDPPAPETVEVAPTDPPPLPDAPPEPDPVEAPPEEASEPAENPTNRLRFVSYNLKNYLAMPRYENGQRMEDRFKADNEVKAVVRMITAARPDVVGVSEIGTYDDLVHLQKQLREAGLDLPHVEHTGGADETRHLGLLSRLPVTSRNTPLDLTYPLQGREFTMSRGILDTTIEARDKKIRFLGVHLKSKREVPEADQELMRRNEAYLLRKHLDTIFEENPEALVLAYGDYNDTRRSTALRSAQGAYNAPGFLEALTIADSRGEVWTHYWDYEHIYSRFDYVLVSKALRKLVEDKECRILDTPDWREASDHRPILTVLDW